MTHITYDDVVAELPAIIATRGENFVYQIHSDGEYLSTCTYIHKGKPDCIMGCYLVSKGVPIEVFTPHEGMDVEDLLKQPSIAELVTATPEATKLMWSIQDNQDRYHTWGDAYRKAVENIKEDEF